MSSKKRLDLSCEVIGEKPRYFNFAEGYPERWELAVTPDEEDEDSYMPMMNYLYPLGENFEVSDDWKDKLVSMTIVQVDEEFYLALTGGGMDMSWEICESYINLGYYPPTHFCQLPHMAGWKETQRSRYIIDCCNESIRVAISWLKGKRIDNEHWFPQACSECSGASPQKDGVAR